MEGDNVAHSELTNTVKGMLREAGLKGLVSADGAILLGFSDVLIQVYGVMDDHAVMVRSIVATGLTPDADLYEFLNTENARITFGKLVYYPDDRRVYFEFPLLADTLDNQELLNAVSLVQHSTDDYNDNVARSWNGEKVTFDNLDLSAAASAERL